MKSLTALSALLVIFMITMLTAQAQQPPSFQYAYLTRHNVVAIETIDPLTGSLTPAPVQPSYSANEEIRFGKASPTGEWVFFEVITGERQSTIRLVNMLTSAQRDIVTRANYRAIEWSPDGQHIAIALRDFDMLSAPFDTYVYSIAQNSLESVGSTIEDDYAVSWSPDGQHLLIVSIGYCAIEGQECPQIAFMEVVEVTSPSNITRTEFFSWRDRLCNFAWSPDSRYVSFQFSCGGLEVGVSGFIYVSDMFLWDTAVNSIVPITSYTQPLSNLNSLDLSQTFFNGYSAQWLSSNQMMIAVTSGRWSDLTGYDPSTVQTGTYIYTIGGSLTSFSTRSIFQGLRNPIYPEWPFISTQPQVILDDTGRNRIRLTDESLQIAAWENNSLNIIRTLPSGCNLHWSPNGRYLLYTITTTFAAGCEREVDKFNIYDRNTGNLMQVQTSPISYDPDAIGWVRAEGSFVTPVPTSTPSSTATPLPPPVTATDTPTSTATDAPSPTPTPTDTPTPTATLTPSVTPTATSNVTFVRGINLGSADVLTIDGNAWVGEDAPGVDLSGYAFCAPSATLTPATDTARAAMIRCSRANWANPQTLVTASGLSNGEYQVYLYVWEDNDAQNFTLSLNGQAVATHNSGSPGRWDKLGPFTVVVTNGAISVSTNGGDTNLSGVEIWRTNAVVPTNTPTATLTPSPTLSGGETWTRIEAESYAAAAAGVYFGGTDDVGGGSAVYDFDTPRWLRFDNVDLRGGLVGFRLRGDSVGSGNLTLRIGSPTGQVLCTLAWSPGGAKVAKSIWQSIH
jgi:hypothetical protein